MSQAFVREGDHQSLEDIGPSMRALVQYLTSQNNGVPIREVSCDKNNENVEIHKMSDGLFYGKDASGKWRVFEP